ncbi:hypothetical protein GQ457_07G000690 [Hibiscus cannabinus]
MEDDVAASDENEESRQMVSDEEDVRREENKVVEQICKEISNTVIQNQILGFGVWRRKPTVLVGKDGESGQENSWGAMEERDKARGGFGANLGTPATENNEVSNQIEDQKHGEKQREIWD